MSINNIENLGLRNNANNKIDGFSFVENSIKPKTKEVSTAGDFGMFFEAAVQALDDTSRLEQEAQGLQLSYITGETDDMLAVSLAEQRAYTALNFTVQVTNKIVEAYRQIISMQI